MAFIYMDRSVEKFSHFDNIVLEHRAQLYTCNYMTVSQASIIPGTAFVPRVRFCLCARIVFESH